MKPAINSVHKSIPGNCGSLQQENLKCIEKSKIEIEKLCNELKSSGWKLKS